MSLAGFEFLWCISAWWSCLQMIVSGQKKDKYLAYSCFPCRERNDELCTVWTKSTGPHLLIFEIQRFFFSPINLLSKTFMKERVILNWYFNGMPPLQQVKKMCVLVVLLQSGLETTAALTPKHHLKIQSGVAQCSSTYCIEDARTLS